MNQAAALAARQTPARMFTWDPYLDAPATCMSIGSAPVKTSRGREELGGRVRALGQRHRTLLLLVDGRRSLAEVLSLGRQAGAQERHFEDLERMGFVQRPGIAAVRKPVPAIPPRLEPESKPVLAPCQVEPPVPVIEPRVDRSLGRARTLLIEMLCVDAPTSVTRFGRLLHAAKNLDDLADVVLEIEHEVSPLQRSHEGRLRLETVRDLLGMGNTHVCEKTAFACLED